MFSFYKTDKANYIKSTKIYGHGYAKFYEKHFSNLRDKKLNILEIGSYSGASAAAFVKYFKNSNVYCFDINISKFVFSSKNIHVYGLDINKRSKVEKILKNINEGSNSNFFDVIIDDGSHYLSDILFSLKIFFKHLKKGGTYIIEDYKYPNYYNYNRDIDHILVDQVLHNLNEKKFFNSSILKNEDQAFLHSNINLIKTFKGNLKDSDICFIEKI